MRCLARRRRMSPSVSEGSTAMACAWGWRRVVDACRSARYCDTVSAARSSRARDIAAHAEDDR